MGKTYLYLYLLLCAVSLIWSGLFIYQSSFVAIDGQRYYSLFDDSMISMRYAWNFAHGQGLVWNAGQRVEGYSNLLMTLAMSIPAVFLDKRLAVLAIQIFGIPTMLGAAHITRQIALQISEDKPYRELIGLLAPACVLFCYPLNYWTLMGMETGLLTLLIMASVLFALHWLKTDRTSDLFNMALMAGLAFLTRNDSLIPSALVFAFIALETYLNKKDKGAFLKILYAGLLFALFPVGQTLIRYFYYGALLPNTYMLKLTRFPLSIRLAYGVSFIQPFLQQSALVLILACLELLLDFRRVKAFLFSLMLAALSYQIYVGGDPWPSWRMLAPAMPAVFILAILTAITIVTRWPRLASQKYAAATFILLLPLTSLALADFPFRSDMTVRGPTHAAISNRVNTNAAVAIRALTGPDASVGVIWAGTLPYYSDRYAVDFLGKSDPYIASLRADVSRSSDPGDISSKPGHNKYDLLYSIVQLQPTYIQAYAWGNQTVRPWVIKNYVRVEYHGALGEKTIFLRKDSPDVCWKTCQDDYKIIPWPKQK